MKSIYLDPKDWASKQNWPEYTMHWCYYIPGKDEELFILDIEHSPKFTEGMPVKIKDIIEDQNGEISNKCLENFEKIEFIDQDDLVKELLIMTEISF